MSEIAMYAAGLALVLATSITGAAQPRRFECEVTQFQAPDLERHPAIDSPDGALRVVLGASDGSEHGWLRVERGATTLETIDLRYLSSNASVKWAPDSLAFFVMWSNGGAVGGFEVRVFRVQGTGVIEMPTTARAAREFANRYSCAARGHNVFAKQWMNGAKELLPAVEVYPTSDCGRNLGRRGGYLVRAADGAILRRYSDAQLRSLWPDHCRD
jgi:hypothetical protein